MLWNGRFVLVHLTLCFALLGLGCGESLKVPTRRDGGTADMASVEAAREDDMATQADAAPAAPDGGKADAVAGPEDASPSADAIAETSALITFRFRNAGSQTVYLRQGCSYPLVVTSEADGKTYSNESFCACDCASSSCQSAPSCGACAPTSGIPVEAGERLDVSWSARISTPQTKTGSLGTFQCVVLSSIPTGIYRVRIAVYPTPEDAVGLTSGKDVEMSFLLTTADATVEVPIQ